MTSRTELYQSYIDGLRPDPVIDFLEWANNNWQLTSHGSAEAGQWRIERVPYLRILFEWANPAHPCQKIVIQKTVQTGLSEFLNMFFGYVMRYYPGPGQYVLPNAGLMNEHWDTKFLPSIEANPELERLIIRAKGNKPGTSTGNLKYKGGNLKFKSAESEASTRSRSIRYMAMDECNAYPRSIGKVGNTFKALEDRTVSFQFNKKIFYVSTPTVSTKDLPGVIEAEYLNSSQAEIYIPCPHCNEFFVLNFSHLNFEHEGITLTSEVTASCPSCGGVIPEHQRLHIAQKCKAIEKYPEREVKGIKLAFGLSPFVSWKQIVKEFLEADAHLKRGDKTSMQRWKNNVCGETWEDVQNKADTNLLMQRAEPYGLVMPKKSYLLTAGVDAGRWYVEYSVIAWGRDFEHWHLQHKILEGDTLRNEIWAELEKELLTMYEWEGRGGLKKRPMFSFVDTGGGSKDDNNPIVTSTFMAYNFVKNKEHLGIFGTKGAGGRPAGRLIGNRSLQKVDSVGGDPRYGEIVLIPAYVDKLKDLLNERLQITEPGPNYIHFPDRYPLKFYQGLTAEYINEKGKWTRDRGAYNEPGDCYNYAAAALELLPGDPTRKESFLNQYCDYVDRQQGWAREG